MVVTECHVQVMLSHRQTAGQESRRKEVEEMEEMKVIMDNEVSPFNCVGILAI